MNGVRALIGLGSNLASPERQVLRAFDEIARIPGVELLKCSSLYRTAPVGFLDQPHFTNAVAAVRCALSPHELLDELLVLEQGHGRVRRVANGPRTLDLDIVLWGDLSIRTERLEVPHPRAHLRAFVLMPLLEVEPDCIIPGVGAARDWLAGCADQAITRIGESSTLRVATGMSAEA